jgi:hypothetical protein
MVFKQIEGTKAEERIRKTLKGMARIALALRSRTKCPKRAIRFKEALTAKITF